MAEDDVIVIESEGEICVPDDVDISDIDNSWSESGLVESDND